MYYSTCNSSEKDTAEIVHYNNESEVAPLHFKVVPKNGIKDEN